jgi:Icc-related predicted phosphoesterase
MRRLLVLFLFVTALVGFKYAYCEDNILAVDVVNNKQKVLTQENKPLTNDENSVKAEAPVEEAKPLDDSEQDFEKIKAYREALENKQNELEVIKLDLEKSDLMLKKRQAEKEIFEIDKSLPQGKTEVSSLPGSSTQGVKDSLVDASDIKIQLLLIAGDLKEGQVILKNAPYSFKEGDTIASKLTAEKIESSGVTFKQPDGSILKLNFIN